MGVIFGGASASELRGIGDAIGAGRLVPPFDEIAVARYVDDPGEAIAVAEGLQRLADAAWERGQVLTLLEAVSAERAAREAEAHQADLVWSGPESREAPSRDTSVVVRELFTMARRSVLVAGYVVYQGRRVFEVLADRMDEDPRLDVRMFLDVQRHASDTSRDEDLLARFAQRLFEKEWSGKRRPDVYYDPRSLALQPEKRSCLHAKCIVVDREAAFVSSANFTEAAQERNIEVGALIRNAAFADQLAGQFDVLVRAGALRRLAT